MGDIEELQRRITSALDKVAAALPELSAASASADDAAQQALEDERTANAQLQERVRSLRAKADAESESLRGQIADHDAQVAKLDTALSQVRKSNDALRKACEALQNANAEGVGDAEAINAAMKAELEALRAARAADVAEADMILASMQTLMASTEGGN